MKYFTKYLPVERELKSQIWQWYNNVNNTGWELISCSDMDAIIAHGLEPQPRFRRVKLFLCSRDIQVGDKVKSPVYEEDLVAKSHELLNGAYHNCFKVIGEISLDAVWVTEGMEFEEDDVHKCFVPDAWPTGTVKIKCSQCKHFH